MPKRITENKTNIPESDETINQNKDKDKNIIQKEEEKIEEKNIEIKINQKKRIKRKKIKILFNKKN